MLRSLTALALVILPCAAHAESFVQNGDLARGSGNTPEEWRTDRWDTSAGATDFMWQAPDGDKPGQAGIKNVKPNDARFVQDLHVREQSWYHITGKVRTENVGQGAIGAYLSLMEGFQNSQDVKGTHPDWEAVELWVKTEKWQDRLTLAVRLGGYSSLNTGEAWFTDIAAEPVSGPAPNAKNIFQPAERTGGIAPLGLWALIMMLSLITGALWYYLRPPPGGEDRGPPDEKLALVGILLVLVVAKIWAAPYFGYATDLGTYKAWALRLADGGPADFYAPNYFADYPPGYMYVLWLLGSIYKGLQINTAGAISTVIVKLPSIVTDFLTSWLLFVLLRPRVGRRLTWIVVLAYALNPAVIFNSAIWGQTDSFFTLELFLGVLLLLQRRIAFGWALVVIAALTKPQALIFMPLLASWGGNWDRPERPLVAAASGLGVAAMLVLPFMEPLGLFALYSKTAAYYAETSVNAFNAMALLGGFRQSDGGMLLFMTYKSWALLLVLLFFGFLGYLISRRRDAEMYLYLCFLLPFGFFMFSTRMHERYLFPCLLFLTLLLVRRPRLWALYVGLTVTYYLNLWYILRALNAGRFLEAYDPLGVAVSVVNVALLGLAVFEGLALAASAPEPLPVPDLDGAVSDAEVTPSADVARAGAASARAVARASGAAGRGKTTAPARSAAAASTRAATPKPAQALWEVEAGAVKYRLRRLDWALALALVVVGGGLRFWHLGQPNELVFDEVYFVEQGKNYLRGKEFMDPHPPLAKLAIGASVALFGGEANGYRVFNAVCGTLLVGVAYLTGRKLLGDGLAAFAAAAAVAFDGLFIVDSRIAVIDIWYVTFGAIAYLLLFEYLRTPPERRHPTMLVGCGVALGLNLASKLFIPAFTWLTVMIFLSILSLRAERAHRTARFWRRGLAPTVLVTTAATATYLALYLPNYYLGWWHSVWDIPKYFKDVVGYEAAVANATHPYSSKWWSWPFLLRPVWYHFKDVPGDSSHVVGVWGGGNPLLWWGGFVAILVAVARGVRERHLASVFLVTAFVLHYVVWSWIGRTLFQYHYLPSLYASLFALAMTLAVLWRASADEGFWVGAGIALLVPLLPTLLGPFPRWGILVFAAIVGLYGAAIVYQRSPLFQWPPGRVIVVAYAVVTVASLIYFYPIWSGAPIARDAYSARMWFQAGPAHWI